MSQHTKYAAIDSAIGAVVARANDLARCKMEEGALDFERPAVKSSAIARLMDSEDPQKPGKKYSATGAAEAVTSDETFALHEAHRREATARTIRAMGEYEAAKLRAKFAIVRSELDIIDEEPVALGLGVDHTVHVG